MRFAYFTHSLVSCWNHGNAHFLRGIVRELSARGHGVDVFEPADGWSRENLLRDGGEAALRRFRCHFPTMSSDLYRKADLDLDRVLDGADVVIAHEWNEPWLIAALSRHRLSGGRYLLLFHDTHHRAATAPEEMGRFDLEGFDGVLAFGEAVREIYLRRGWAARVWTWHEAADTALFHPPDDAVRRGGAIDRARDLVWIGNWGDEERSAELSEFLLSPVRSLGLAATLHGVRYPPEALAAIRAADAHYAGWLPNDAVPEAFAAHRVTVHVPRRPYAQALPGIPTIRVFEALACGIPLVSTPWDDREGLFRAGTDFLVARSGQEMTRLLRTVLQDRALAASLARHGLETILSRHTCAHRVDQLLELCGEFAPGRRHSRESRPSSSGSP